LVEAHLIGVGVGDDLVGRTKLPEPVGAERHRKQGTGGGRGRLDGATQHERQPGGQREAATDQCGDEQTVWAHDRLLFEQAW
jgi:hypothetical protein